MTITARANMNRCLSQVIAVHALIVPQRDGHSRIPGCVVVIASRMRASVS